MSQLYNEFKRAAGAAEIDLDTADIRATLLMSNTTADSENDAIVNVADLTTLDVSDATGYADIDLANQAWTKEDANDRVIFTTDNAVFSGMSGDASRDYVGILLYVYVDGTAANDKVVGYVGFTATKPAAATQVTVTCPAAGWFNNT